jgi:hypothetical protein
MTNPSPERGIFKWARHRAAEHRASFWVGAVAFAVLVTTIGTLVVLPPNPTLAQKLLSGLGGLAVATAIVVVLTYVEALLVAPYQQRNVLRHMVVQLRARVAELETTSVSQEHADRLRQIARTIKRCIEEHRPLDFSSPDGTDSLLWRRSFFEHFPEMQEMIEEIERTGAARVALLERLRREVRAAGMDKLPWLPDRFIGPVALIIEVRASTGLLQGEFNFHWRRSLDFMCIDAIQIFDMIKPPVDTPAMQREFEEFFRAAETWPEATEILEAQSLSHETEEPASAALGVIANKDTITTRCLLCST